MIMLAIVTLSNNCILILIVKEQLKETPSLLTSYFCRTGFN
jgi:hypothetical protein